MVINIEKDYGLGLDISYKATDITSYLEPYYKKTNKEFIEPKYELIFIPFWTFEYHTDLDKGIGLLNAVDSEILLSQDYLHEIIVNNVSTVEEICKQSKFQLIDESISKPLLYDKKDAYELLKYKLPKIKQKPDVFVTKLNMYYIPYWSFKVMLDKKAYNFVVNATSPEDYKAKLNDFVKSKIDLQKKKTDNDLFNESIDEAFSIRGFFDNLIDLTSYILLGIWGFCISTYKKNKVLFLVSIIILFILIYYLIK